MISAEGLRSSPSRKISRLSLKQLIASEIKAAMTVFAKEHLNSQAPSPLSKPSLPSPSSNTEDKIDVQTKVIGDDECESSKQTDHLEAESKDGPKEEEKATFDEKSINHSPKTWLLIF